MKKVPYSKNREAIYDLLTRAKRYHCNSHSVHELDAEPLLHAVRLRREAGRPVRFHAYLVKATSLVMQRFPRLNHHLFHTPLGKREVDFEEIACNLIMLREDDGEEVLLPVVIERSDQLSVDEISDVLTYHLTTPLNELPQIQGVQKLKRLPRPALKLFSFLSRSSPRFYRRFFGTYGMSSLIPEGPDGPMMVDLGQVTHTVHNTAAAFVPTALGPRPRMVGDRVEIRPTLTMMLGIDHYVVDGHDGVRCMAYLNKLLLQPGKLDPVLADLQPQISPVSSPSR